MHPFVFWSLLFLCPLGLVSVDSQCHSDFWCLKPPVPWSL